MNAPLFKLATNIKVSAPPHTYGPEKMLRAPLIQKEKVCARCGLVRITVLQGVPRRAYRWGDGGTVFEDWKEPECIAQ